MKKSFSIQEIPTKYHVFSYKKIQCQRKRKDIFKTQKGSVLYISISYCGIQEHVANNEDQTIVPYSSKIFYKKVTKAIKVPYV